MTWDSLLGTGVVWRGHQLYASYVQRRRNLWRDYCFQTYTGWRILMMMRSGEEPLLGIRIMFPKFRSLKLVLAWYREVHRVKKLKVIDIHTQFTLCPLHHAGAVIKSKPESVVLRVLWCENWASLTTRFYLWEGGQTSPACWPLCSSFRRSRNLDWIW